LIKFPQKMLTEKSGKVDGIIEEVMRGIDVEISASERASIQVPMGACPPKAPGKGLPANARLLSSGSLVSKCSYC